ncbi:arabinose operon transcriptional regulator AraC [Martelella alba]|uniref:Arabinose operon transcriptional regulator AraC n=1 Tax=Martelella alba TaxID=2590451 RepID=A0ABY2SEX2_9HYPH|nr:arabinose operon transcriptional regulator AraC [Martelella alba]TKI02399.1 arabinose operon transcriptional regulator AraC [Martelella alba]
MCFTFDAYLVAGFTPVLINGPHDTPVFRPDGMDGYIINLTVKGSAWVETEGGKILHVEKNDMLIFPPGVKHHYGRQVSEECWDHFWIYFIPRPYWKEWLQWQNDVGGVSRIKLSSDAESDTVKTLFTEAITWFSDNNALSEAMAMNVLERIILSCYRMQYDSLHKTMDIRITAICQHLDNNLFLDESLAKLASRVSLSPSRLSHLFRRDTGMTINEWKEKQRIYCARNMLQSSTLSVADIARANGYNDAFYFSKIFHRHCGISPSTYRKNYAKNSVVTDVCSDEYQQ